MQKAVVGKQGGGGGGGGRGAIHYKTFPLYISYKNVLYLNIL